MKDLHSRSSVLCILCETDGLTTSPSDSFDAFGLI